MNTDTFVAGETTIHPRGKSYCWICSVKGTMHSHHVIPRNAGGNNGPQVLICNKCHEGIHDVAKKYKNKGFRTNSTNYINEYSNLPEAKTIWKTPAAMTKVIYLVNIIIDAEGLAGKSDNKSVKMNLTLTGRENLQLIQIARSMGLSKVNTLKRLISMNFKEKKND